MQDQDIRQVPAVILSIAMQLWSKTKEKKRSEIHRSSSSTRSKWVEKVLLAGRASTGRLWSSKKSCEGVRNNLKT
jgi:hypothetical protein